MHYPSHMNLMFWTRLVLLHLLVFIPMLQQMVVMVNAMQPAGPTPADSAGSAGGGGSPSSSRHPLVQASSRLPGGSSENLRRLGIIILLLLLHP